MCGIAGASWSGHGKPLSLEELKRMTNVISHRGPDDSGHYCSADAQSSSDAHFVLGHRRLSIIDLQSGHQPLSNEDGSIWITFNGEIYNYRELRPSLERQGHQFQTSSDTEVIVHLYEQYGENCVDHLRGMFVFAIWDDKRKSLFLARDRIGQKPLFYRSADERLIFASELKALLQLTDSPRELNPIAVDQFLAYQYVPHPNCILKGYHKLPPAHWLKFHEGQIQIERYWRPPYEEEQPVATATDWQSQLRETLTESVRLRMRSDVPLGAFLSGGIDSTIIAGLMQQLSERPVHTFSIGFPVKRFDETSYAREAASFLGTEHHEMVVEPSALEILPKLIWHYDEPFADSSAIPTMYLSQMTRQHVTVSLSGDGGDELFAGYDRYKAVRLGVLFDRLPKPLQSVLTARIWQRIPTSVQQKSFRRRLKRLLSALGEEPERRYLKWIATFDDQRRSNIYDSTFAEQLADTDAASFLFETYRECPSRDFITRTTCADVLSYLPCDILTKVDIASMAFSLECRSPFLDHHVAELAARIPMESKLRGRYGKHILIKTFSDLLPASIQTRKKMGFGVPLDHWFRNELKPLLYDLLLDDTSLNRGYFNSTEIRRLVDEHTAGHWDHSYRLWSLLCFESWHRMFLDSHAVPTTAPASI